GLGCSPFARRYLGNHLLVFFSWGYLDVSVPPVCLHPKVNIPVNRDGLPHSDIRGSSLLCSSPRLIAALHVLHRLCMPRHPPCALNCFVYMVCTAHRAAHTLTA